MEEYLLKCNHNGLSKQLIVHEAMQFSGLSPAGQALLEKREFPAEWHGQNDLLSESFFPLL